MPIKDVITPRQARAARAVLNISVRELAKQSGISESSIRRIEDHSDRKSKTLPVTLETFVKLQAFLESKGLEFAFTTNRAGVSWVRERNYSLLESLRR